jgi:hypothetical protein
MNLINLLNFLLISDLFISSFGLSLSQLYTPACILPLHVTFLVLLAYSVY